MVDYSADPFGWSPKTFCRRGGPFSLFVVVRRDGPYFSTLLHYESYHPTSYLLRRQTMTRVFGRDLGGSRYEELSTVETFGDKSTRTIGPFTFIRFDYVKLGSVRLSRVLKGFLHCRLGFALLTCPCRAHDLGRPNRKPRLRGSTLQ